MSACGSECKIAQVRQEGEDDRDVDEVLLEPTLNTLTQNSRTQDRGFVYSLDT